MDNAPTLAVGFAIQTDGAFESLTRLDRLFDDKTNKVLRQVAEIERQTGGMMTFGGASARINSFASEANRQLRAVASETAALERSGERMAASLDRQAEGFGRTRAEMRATAAEAKALALENAGMTELAGRVRAPALALQAKEDAAALERLRASTDPLYAATKRVNDEIAESNRLMKAGVLPMAEHAKQQEVLTDRLITLGHGNDEAARAFTRNGFAMRSVATQMPDVVQGLLTGQKPMQVFIQQGAQIYQVAQMAEGGVRGFAGELGGLALRFAPVIAVAGLATTGFELFNRYVNQGVGNDQLTRDLGSITGGADATRQELYKLRDAEVTWADTSKALFSTVGKDVRSYFVGDMKAMSKDVQLILDDMTSYGRRALAGLYAGVAGTRSYLGEIEKGG